jgi:nucleoside-diphosphate-sugar epimerase
MIYGPGELWHSLLGVEVTGPWWLGAGTHRVLPMAWVENVADAFVAAVERDASIGETVNVVDDDLPTVGAYLTAVTPLVTDPPRIVPLPYRVTDSLVAGLDVANRTLFDGRAKLPSGLRPGPFAARFRPLRYSNERAKRVLGWTPRVDLQEAVARSARVAAKERS